MSFNGVRDIIKRSILKIAEIIAIEDLNKINFNELFSLYPNSVINEAFKELKESGAIVSPVRCKWELVK